MAAPRSNLAGLAPGRTAPAARPVAKNASNPAAGPSFSEFLKAATLEAAPLTFSTHAAKRLAQRNIQFSPDQMARLQSALNKVRAKGSRESLFLTPDAALVVGVKQGIVITAMDRNDLKDAVITNIDATVVVE